MRVIFLFLLATAGLAQPLPPGERDSLPAIEAIVLDAAGHTPTGLTAADFSLQFRKPLKIASCTYVDMSKRRKMVFAVDDLGLTTDAIGRVRAAIEKFLDTDLQPGDRLAILRSGSGNGEWQQLTGDKEALHRAAARLYYNPRQATFGSAAARAGAFNTGAMGNVRQALAGLRQLPGRKSVVLFSAGLDQQPVTALQALATDAKRDQVSVFGIDVSPPGAGPVALNQFSAVSLAALAKRTGGELLDAGAALGQVLAGALSGPSGYYLIRYRPIGEGAFPDLTVVRPGMQLVSARRLSAMSQASEFAGDSLLGAPQIGEDNLVRAVSDPFSTGQIHTRVTPLFYNDAQGSGLAAVVYVDVHDLTFREGLDGTYHGGASILVAAFGSTALSLGHSEKSFELRWKPDEYREGLRAGIVIGQNLAIRSTMQRLRDSTDTGGKRAGALAAARSAMLQIVAVVSDGNSGKMGSATEWVEVPDMEDGRLAISGIELNGPEESDNVDRFLLKEPDETPAVRIFRNHVPIGYRCDLYNLTTEAGKSSQVDLQLEFFREGRRETTTAPVAIVLQAGGDPRRSAISGHLTLPPNMAPGRYVVRFTVTEKLAAGPPRVASQFVDFELRP